MNRLLPLAAALALGACQMPPQPEERRYFFTEVKPVLERQCLRCHSGPTPPAGLSLEHRDGGAFKRRPDGSAYLVPGQPDASLLIRSVARGGTHPKLMPRLDVSLTDDEIGVLREWVEDGAWWPRGSDGLLRPHFNPENP
jgi:hypothetical protein